MGDVVRDLLYPQGVERWGLSRVAGLSLLGSRQTGCENQERKKKEGFSVVFFLAVASVLGFKKIQPGDRKFERLYSLFGLVS